MPERLFSAFREVCLRQSDRTFVFEVRKAGSVPHSIAFGEILRDAEALRARLRLLSLSRGSKVGLISENRYEWITAYLATVSLGLISVPLDARLHVEDWARCLEHAGSELVFLSDRLGRQAPALFQKTPCLNRLVVLGRDGGVLGGKYETYEGIVREFSSHAEELEDESGAADEIASLVYTSGTTGRPKGVMLTHGNLLTNARCLSEGVAPRDVFATILPFNHTFGFTTCLSVLLGGRPIVVYPELQPETVLRSFRDLHPTALLTVPAFLERVGQSIRDRLRRELGGSFKDFLEKRAGGRLGERADRLALVKKAVFRKVHQSFGGRLDRIIVGGAPLEASEIRFFQLMGIHVLEGYGLTETSPVVAFNFQGRNKIGSVGRPVDGAEVRIADPSPDGVGEIRVRGPMVMTGYYRNPEATAVALDGDGWFRTGDLGRIDEDGFLHVAGRIKDLIVTPNGKKVSPEDVEHALGRIPYASEICVFGLPKPGGGRGEIVHVEIVPDVQAFQASGSRHGAEEVYTAIRREVARVADGLPEFMRPRSLGFSRDPFPRTATLKIKKFEVRRKVLEEKASRLEEQAAERALANDGCLSGPVGVLVSSVLRKLNPSVRALFVNSHFTYDLGCESLAMIEFWTMMEKAFDVTLPPETIAGLKEVGAVIDHFEALPGSGEKARAALALLEGESAAEIWGDVLGGHAERSCAVSREVLSSHRRVRPLFLSVFARAFRALSGLRVEGLEHLPAGGPYILAPNHECYLDNLLVACLLPRTIQDRMAVVGAKEFFDRPATRVIASLCRAIPVDRSNVSGSVLQIGAQILRDGGILLVHPEGTRSPDGELLPFKNGAAMLAAYVGCPIVPVYIEGAHEFWPKGARFPRSRSRITVTIGRPIEPASVPSRPDGDQVRRAERLTARLKEQMESLRDARRGPKDEATADYPGGSDRRNEPAEGIEEALATGRTGNVRSRETHEPHRGHL